MVSYGKHVRQSNKSLLQDPSHGTIDGDRFFRMGTYGISFHPWRPPCSIFVMDNATIHANPEMENLINRKGAILIKLPAYSPDLNPIE